ncbi:RHS repeat protein [Hahella sp. KA22]|uniref:DUF6531 domain-containing protein n=1 Tax=Hahella sp. KA22 TaxID=1628392 RepID=UPI000FDDBECC|nr:DUF6531 domain-containing protein [Hahella sp. KA22]AZZ94007.1 RHS repeat protein [Hahella sp. KA22]QAY57381.1 RHS repeat protein [Hahella sp. KA22]
MLTKSVVIISSLLLSLPTSAQEYYWIGGPYGDSSNSPMSICNTYNASATIGSGVTTTRLTNHAVGKLACQGFMGNASHPAIKDKYIFAFFVKRVGDDCPSNKKFEADTQACTSRSPYPAKQCTKGNPIIVSSGEKVQTEVDFQNAFGPGSHYVRTYKSKVEAPQAHGSWSLPFSRKIAMIEVPVADNYVRLIRVVRDDGAEYHFRRDNATGQYSTYTDTLMSLEGFVDEKDKPTGYKLHLGNEVEEYDRFGRLLSVSGPYGTNYEVQYGTFTTITSKHGQTLTLKYKSDRLTVESITHSDGRKVSYTYNAKGLVETASFYQAPNYEVPLHTKTYHYEKTGFPTLLTGITDESGVRYVTWDYDEQGRGILSEHAGSNDRYQFAYPDALTTEVTNPLGKVTTYEFENFNGYERIKAVKGADSENCLASNRSYSYNDQGLLSGKVDANGVATSYDHNERGLEVKRIEAKGTPEERVTLTEWHPTLRLPIKITEPDRITEFTYDDDGKLKSKSIQPVAGS